MPRSAEREHVASSSEAVAEQARSYAAGNHRAPYETWLTTPRSGRPAQAAVTGAAPLEGKGRGPGDPPRPPEPHQVRRWGRAHFGEGVALLVVTPVSTVLLRHRRYKTPSTAIRTGRHVAAGLNGIRHRRSSCHRVAPSSPPQGQWPVCSRSWARRKLNDTARPRKHTRRPRSGMKKLPNIGAVWATRSGRSSSDETP